MTIHITTVGLAQARPNYLTFKTVILVMNDSKFLEFTYGVTTN